ncbi:MAG: pyruvate:ferredoxin (flavodoxin) oxidoreductase, partial [Coriobacteriales bacterium]|nr:pyruvate:ferredoxin (flavodoxin) oxidoreductase [Coriobacteriales bacterium]
CKDSQGRGPAWEHSLFEDNAEFVVGMYIGFEASREMLVKAANEILASGPDLVVRDTLEDWLANKDDANESKRVTAELLPFLEQMAEDGSEAAAKMLEHKDHLTKKSFWIFGGDGWAYDIGFGGLDHVLASGKDVNIFVFDTEVYSNTGGQASKASNIGQVAQFAAAGKDIKKKSLAEIAISYGYVYVAQVAMGAKPAQTLKAIQEAEAYPGPSIIIGYSPCEMHSIKGGMLHCQDEMKKAVDCGYWNLFRFNPNAGDGNKFILDSKEPQGGYREFLMNEARYSRLTREFPERAEELFAGNERAAMERHEHLLKLKEMYSAL